MTNKSLLLADITLKLFIWYRADDRKQKRELLEKIAEENQEGSTCNSRRYNVWLLAKETTQTCALHIGNNKISPKKEKKGAELLSHI